MNKTQKIILAVGLAVFVFMSCFPPRCATTEVASGVPGSPPLVMPADGMMVQARWRAGAAQPPPKQHVDVKRLCIELATVVLATGGLVLLAQKRRA